MYYCAFFPIHNTVLSLTVSEWTMDEHTIDNIIDGDWYNIPASQTIYDQKAGTSTVKTTIERIPRLRELEELDKAEVEQDTKDFGRPTYKRVYFYAGILDLEKEFLQHREPRILEQRTSELIRDTLNLYTRLSLRDIEQTLRIAGLQTMLVAIKTKGNRLFEGKSVYNNRGERCMYGYATVFADPFLRERYYEGQDIGKGDHAENMDRLAKAGHIPK
jgi:hypothetical protein